MMARYPVAPYIPSLRIGAVKRSWEARAMQSPARQFWAQIWEMVGGLFRP